MRSLALLAAISTLASCAAPEGSTLYVQPAADGELDDPTVFSGAAAPPTFTTIQAAIDAASSGDTVSVPAGTYTEDLTMKDGVTVDGAGVQQTWIYGTVTFSAVTATLSGVSLVSPDYIASGTRYVGNGVYVTNSTATLTDISSSYFQYGVYAYDGGTVLIDDALLSYNWYGAGADYTANFTVQNSLVGSNAAGGVFANNSTTGTIAHNTFVGNAFAGTATYLTGAVALGTGTVNVANNVVTSNYYGIDCDGCSGTRTYNLVWGNTTNYVNDASADPSDLSADPLFADAGEGDYTLTAASPAVDAGTAAYGVSTDASGDGRPQGAGYDLGFDEYAVSSYDLVITEVMSNAVTESTGEFVEIYNAGTGTVDLDGLVITDGDETDVLQAYGSSGTTLAPGAYAVVLDPNFAADYTLPAGTVTLTTQDTEVGNGLTTSDPIRLYEPDGSTLAASFSFPTDPGNGVSSELLDLATGDVAGNWRASACSGGSSPGAADCFAEAGDPADLVITEVLANASDESTGEYVELYNGGSAEIDAAGLVLGDSASRDTLVGFQGGSTLVGPGEHAVIVDPGYTYGYYLPTDVVLLTTSDSTLGNGLSTTDRVYLYDTDGSTVIDSFSSPSDPGDGVSIEKADYALGDTSTNWVTADCTRGLSPGRLNGAAGGLCAPVLINEVMSNPLDEDLGEYVELYNAGGVDVELAGLVLGDGTETDTIASFDGGSTVLPAGGWAVLVDSEYAGAYSIDPSVVVVTLSDSTLGNGLSVSDEVYLYEADGVSLIDGYIWPTNPGNGVAVERVAMSGALDTASNWTGSTCASGGSPGAANCVATGTSGSSTSSYDLVITEVLANPLDEGTGEFVEIYNAGSTSIDLLYMVLWDGDAVDTVFGFTDPYDTVLAPGEYAVVLDADYAGAYTIPADALLLTVDDSTIGSGLATNDPVYLYESGGTALIDSFTSPSDPGNGTSIVRVDVTVGDTSSNWATASCSPTPGSGACQ